VAKDSKEKYVQWVPSRSKNAKDGGKTEKGHKDEEWVFMKNIKPMKVAPGFERKVLAYCDEAMVIASEFDKGATVADHVHAHTQITYIQEGRFSYSVEGVAKEVAKGDSVCVPSGATHTTICLEKGSLVEFFTPMRKDFLR